jgi:hypothetical protein
LKLSTYYKKPVKDITQHHTTNQYFTQTSNMEHVVFDGVTWKAETCKGNVVSFWRFTDEKKTKLNTISKNPLFTTYFRNNVRVKFDEIYAEYVNQ